MKLNEVKFLPKGNAVADVYTKATGMAIVGEMMVAAAGNGGNDDKTVWYVAYSDDQGTHETSRGTARQTGVVDSDTGMQELEIITNNKYQDLVGQKAWVSDNAKVDDGEYWEMEMPLGTASGLYVSFFSDEPTPPTPTQKAEAPTYTYSQDTTYCSNYDVTLYGNLTVNLATTTPNATIHLRAWYVDPPVTAEDFDWSSLYGPWYDLSSHTYDMGGDFNYNAIMIAYASADGMENSDYTYITIPYQHTEATTCDEIKPVYDLKFEYGGSGEIMNVTAKTLTDLTLNKIHFTDGGMVDIQLVQNDPSDNTLTLDPDYTNMMDNLYDSHTFGQLTISDQESTEVVYSGDLEGVVIPYVEVMSVDVMNSIPDNYDIQLNLNVMPQEWMMNIDLEGTFEGCEETLMFNKMNNYFAHYDGQANFVDGGTYTLTDVERTLTLTGTYTFMPLT